jgi:hypothetical protein
LNSPELSTIKFLNFNDYKRTMGKSDDAISCFHIAVAIYSTHPGGAPIPFRTRSRLKYAGDRHGMDKKSGMRL